MDRLQGRRALVSGAASGIGRATALRLHAEGATVVGVDVSVGGLAETAAAAGDERFTTVEINVADEGSVAAGVTTALDRLGGLDVLVNAAGILRSAHTEECSLELWNTVIGINLTGTFLVTRAALPALVGSGRGVVVNFSSTSAGFAHPYMAAYAASKGGIQAFTHVLALEYAKAGLRAVSVAPGAVHSGITATTAEGLPADTDWGLFAKLQPILPSGFAEPEAVAGVIAMLASDDGVHITGTEIRIDGGTHA